jgi:hypothetical protein
MLSGKHEEKRPPGRTRCRWVDNVTAYRNEVEVVRALLVLTL